MFIHFRPSCSQQHIPGTSTSTTNKESSDIKPLPQALTACLQNFFWSLSDWCTLYHGRHYLTLYQHLWSNLATEEETWTADFCLSLPAAFLVVISETQDNASSYTLQISLTWTLKRNSASTLPSYTARTQQYVVVPFITSSESRLGSCSIYIQRHSTDPADEGMMRKKVSLGSYEWNVCVCVSTCL